MRIVFKYCFPIYAQVQIFRLAPQFFGLGPDTRDLGLFWHLGCARMQGNLAAGYQCQPLPCPYASSGQLTLHTTAKVMGIGWTKSPKVREIFLSSLIQKEGGSP